MPYYGITQNQVESGRVLHIAGTRALQATSTVSLPNTGRVTQGNEPSGYADFGALMAGRVEINVEMPKEGIDIGRIPATARQYLGSQKGTIKFSMQEYQPEMIALAAGYTIDTSISGVRRIYIGGALPPIKRLLLLDDFDIDGNIDNTEPWLQYWWTTPAAQGGGTFTRGEDKLAYVIPFTFDLLKFDVSGYSRMLEFRAIAVGA